MGVRITGTDGNWRYVTSADLGLVALVKFSSGTAWGPALSGNDVITRLGGECASIYKAMVSRLMGLAVWDSSGNFEPGQTIRPSGFTAGKAPPSWTMLQKRIDADLYTLEGADLLRWRKEIYGVTDDGVARVLVGAAAADREKLTGLVRRMADAFAEKAVKKARVTGAQFEKRKLRVTVEVSGRAKETLTFTESDHP
jgi:hypothetical protein